MFGVLVICRVVVWVIWLVWFGISVLKVSDGLMWCLVDVGVCEGSMMVLVVDVVGCDVFCFVVGLVVGWMVSGVVMVVLIGIVLGDVVVVLWVIRVSFSLVG